MRHTRKRRSGSGVGQVIPRGGAAEAQEEGEKRRWRILATNLNPIPILFDLRDTEKTEGCLIPLPPLLPLFSLSHGGGRGRAE